MKVAIGPSSKRLANPTVRDDSKAERWLILNVAFTVSMGSPVLNADDSLSH